MNPDSGEEPEDWFARFEREAREAALQREQEQAAQPPAAQPPVVPPLVSPPAAPPPVIANPFDPPAAPPPVFPAPPAFPAAPVPPAAAMPPAGPPAAPPPAWEPQPTQAMDRIEPEPTQAYVPPTEAFAPEPTQALVPAPLRPPGPAEAPGSALDSLFGEDRFREYERGPDPNEAPFASRSRSKELVRVDADGTPAPPRPMSRTAKILLGAGGGALAVLALGALFLVGTRLPDLLGPAPAVVASPTPSPSASLGPLPVGPVAVGEHRWDDLLGGECLEPYTDAWQDDYTVVDCADPHTAQLVFRDRVPDALTGAPFPGADALQQQIGLLCGAPGVVDLAAAGAYVDAQLQGSYPVTAEQWKEEPSYYCFFSRSSGEQVTGSVAVPR